VVVVRCEGVWGGHSSCACKGGGSRECGLVVVVVVGHEGAGCRCCCVVVGWLLLLWVRDWAWGGCWR
jgi:hypothetical protein